jgi:hypothetical protein
MTGLRSRCAGRARACARHGARTRGRCCDPRQSARSAWRQIGPATLPGRSRPCAGARCLPPPGRAPPVAACSTLLPSSAHVARRALRTLACLCTGSSAATWLHAQAARAQPGLRERRRRADAAGGACAGLCRRAACLSGVRADLPVLREGVGILGTGTFLPLRPCPLCPSNAAARSQRGAVLRRPSRARLCWACRTLRAPYRRAAGWNTQWPARAETLAAVDQQLC